MAMSEAYGERFYRAQMAGAYRSARAVLGVVFELFAPGSVVDIGCGTGMWLRAAKELGAQRILGFDGGYVDDRMLQIEREAFRPIDLEHERLVIPEKFDLAMSLEVAEHLSRARAETFVADLCRAADTVLFSAAVPGQGGTHHVNEQFPSFWVPLFATHGFACFDVIRPRIWTNREIEVWYRQNTLVFSKDRVVWNGRTEEPILDLVHPELWENRGRIRKLMQWIHGDITAGARSMAAKWRGNRSREHQRG